MTAHDNAVVVRVWDLPTRLAHAVLVLLIPFSWWSAETHHLDWHRLSGYGVLSTLLFRLAWGVVGSETSRFSRFVKGPRAIFAYLRGLGRPVLGHNPLGALSIIAMLVLLVVQVGLGLFAVDEDGIDPSPLAKFVDFDTGRAVAKLHHLNFTAIQILVGLHLAAVAFYAVRGQNLVGPMVTGRKTVATGAGQPRLRSVWLALGLWLACGALTWFIARGLRI